MPTIPRPSFPTIAVFILFIAVFAGIVPAYYDYTQGDVVKTLEQTQNEEIVIFGNLHSVVIDIGNQQGQDYVNVTLFDIDTGESYFTGELFEGENRTLDFDNGDVTITNVEVTGTETIIMNYTLPVQYQWSRTQATIISAIPALLLILFLYIMLIFVDLEVET